MFQSSNETLSTYQLCVTPGSQNLGFHIPFNSQGRIGTGPQYCHLLGLEEVRGGHGGRVVTLSPPTSEAGVQFPARPQVGKLVVACRLSAVYSTELWRTVCTGFLCPSNYPSWYDLYSVESDVKPQINKQTNLRSQASPKLFWQQFVCSLQSLNIAMFMSIVFVDHQPRDKKKHKKNKSDL